MTPYKIYKILDNINTVIKNEKKAAFEQSLIGTGYENKEASPIDEDRQKVYPIAAGPAENYDGLLALAPYFTKAHIVLEEITYTPYKKEWVHLFFKNGTVEIERSPIGEWKTE